MELPALLQEERNRGLRPFFGAGDTYQTISKDAITQDYADDVTQFHFYREISTDESVLVSLVVSIFSMFVNGPGSWIFPE